MNIFQNPVAPFWEKPESRRLEFKETFPKGNQIAKTAIAFANGAGGKIVFGVRDNPREIVGIPDAELFLMEERVSDHIFTTCAPNILPEISIQSVEGKSLLVVEVFPGSHRPYHLRKKGRRQGAFIRVGSTNRPASPEILESLERQRRNVSFDAVPAYDVHWQDVNLENFLTAYAEATGKPLEETHMRNLGLLIREREQTHPSNGAILLSDDGDRVRRFPFAKIECARFKGVTMDVFIDQATVNLPLHKVPEACMAFVKRNIALSARIGEIHREDRWEYPLEAVREVVINAVVHRDYALMGSDTKIAIYDDMLEITSPGPLPDTLSPEDLGTGRSVIRNRVIALIFKDLGLIEAWGSGMLKIRQAVSEYPETDVVFREAGHAFQVQFVKRETDGSVPSGTQSATSGTKPAPSGTKPAPSGTKSAPNGAKSAPNGTQSAPSGAKSAPNGAKSAPNGTKSALSAEQLRVLEICKSPLPISKLLEIVHRSDRTKFRKSVLNPLIDSGLVVMTHPDKPNSPKQKYKATDKAVSSKHRAHSLELRAAYSLEQLTA